LEHQFASPANQDRLQILSAMTSSDKNQGNSSLATTNNLNIETGVEVEKVFIIQGVTFDETKRKDMT